MENLVHISEYMHFRLMSEEFSAKIYLKSYSEAKMMFKEILRLGTSKDVYVYIHNNVDTYRKINLNPTNKKEWDAFFPDNPKINESCALMGSSKFNNKKIILELFNNVGVISNAFSVTKPTIYVRYVDEKTSTNFIKVSHTLDIPKEIKDIVVKYNGKIVDYEGKTISFFE